MSAQRYEYSGGPFHGRTGTTYGPDGPPAHTVLEPTHAPHPCCRGEAVYVLDEIEEGIAYYQWDRGCRSDIREERK